jgi:molybdopterin-guanine dinucleotide biosynthesis protein A
MSIPSSGSRLGGLVLAGGTSRRMGADKALLDWGGRRAIDRVFDLAASVCGDRVLVSGRDYGLPFVADPHLLAGPTAGILAGAAALRAKGCTAVLVLAVDAPTLTAADLTPLLEGDGPGFCYEGLPIPMAARIDALPFDAPGAWPLRRLVETAGLTILECPPQVQLRARGANDDAERAVLLAQMAPAAIESGLPPIR